MLIQTKLNRPPLPVDMVHRPRLTKWLKRHQRRPLTLISAPAGYGKSTLISCWLSSVDCPTAWVSLDEHDNQLGNFLSYFLATIQTIFPNALPETRTLLLVTPQPSTTAIVQTIINELDQIGKSFILVLDDYHLIESQAIHDLLSELLAYPPHGFHLVLSTRMDPPLPLIALRAKNQMTEIRIQDLRFTQEETQRLFQEMLGNSVDPEKIDKMNTQAEGWVTGLLAGRAGLTPPDWCKCHSGRIIRAKSLCERISVQRNPRRTSGGALQLLVENLGPGSFLCRFV